MAQGNAQACRLVRCLRPKRQTRRFLHSGPLFLDGLCRDLACLAFKVFRQIPLGLLVEGRDRHPVLVAGTGQRLDRDRHPPFGTADFIRQHLDTGEKAVKLAQDFGNQNLAGKEGATNFRLRENISILLSVDFVTPFFASRKSVAFCPRSA